MSEKNSVAWWVSQRRQCSSEVLTPSRTSQGVWWEAAWWWMPGAMGKYSVLIFLYSFAGFRYHRVRAREKANGKCYVVKAPIYCQARA